MFHLALSPLGWGLVVGGAGVWLLKRSGRTVSGTLGAAAGISTALAKKGANALGVGQKKAEKP